MSQADLSSHEAESVEVVAAFHRDHHQRTSAPQRAIDSVTGRLGRPAGAMALIVGLGAWIAYAAVAGGGRVDQPAFAWLEFAATTAALLIALLILVTQRRADELAGRRAQLTLDLAVLAERKNAKIISLLEELRRDHPSVVDRVDAESEAMSTPVDPQAVVAAIDEQAET